MHVTSFSLEEEVLNHFLETLIVFGDFSVNYLPFILDAIKQTIQEEGVPPIWLRQEKVLNTNNK